MPIPKPTEKESKDKFITRCMGDGVMTKEYPDRTIRAGVCYRSWRENNDAELTQMKKASGGKLEDYVKVAGYDDQGVPIVQCEAISSDVEFNDAEAGDIIGKGWFTTELANRNGQKVLAEGFDWEGAFDRFNGRVLAFHDRGREPVGVVESYEVRSQKGGKKGIRGVFRLFKENPETFMRAVRSGVLNDLSIGFGVLDWEWDEENQIFIFKRQYLSELSVVNIGAAPEAKFTILNSLQLNDSGQVTAPYVKKETHKVDPELKARLDAIEQNAVKTVDHEQAVKELRDCYNGVKDGLADFQAGVLTKDELSVKFEKIGEKFNEITTDLEAVKQLRSMREHYVVYDDVKSLINDQDIVWLTDDNGVQVSPIEQRAYKLFQMPVNYDKLNCGQELKNLRNLHDAFIFWHAYAKKRKSNFRVENSKLWKQLVNAVQTFDEEVYNAMAGGNTGYGAEFVPTEMSAEFNELLRITPTVSQHFQIWNMPRGGSAYYPFQNGRAVAYKGSEATVNNPVEARKTNIATDRKLFTPDVFIGALVSSEELSEDSIIDMETFIRNELATVILEKLDSAIINGDTTSPHQDNDEATVYETYDLETAFIGLRAMAADDSKTFNIETVAGDTGVGALTLSCFTHCKGLMAEAGMRSDQCIFVTGMKGRIEIQKALWAEDASGILAYMISGALPTIDGSKVVISGMYNEALESDGLAGTDADHTSLCSAHTPSWRIGQRRGVTVEYDKNILTQQKAFVATARFDFGKICASSIYPVACGINIQHT